jgi:hypothetical protein
MDTGKKAALLLSNSPNRWEGTLTRYRSCEDWRRTEKEHFGLVYIDTDLTLARKGKKNHGTQDSRVVPHRGTNWAALWLTAQIGRDAVLSESYGRGYLFCYRTVFIPLFFSEDPPSRRISHVQKLSYTYETAITTDFLRLLPPTRMIAS